MGNGEELEGVKGGETSLREETISNFFLKKCYRYKFKDNTFSLLSIDFHFKNTNKNMYVAQQ